MSVTKLLVVQSLIDLHASRQKITYLCIFSVGLGLGFFCVCFVLFLTQTTALIMEVRQCSLGSLTVPCCFSVSLYHSSGSTFGSWPEGKTSVSEQDQTSVCFYAVSASVYY